LTFFPSKNKERRRRAGGRGGGNVAAERSTVELMAWVRAIWARRGKGLELMGKGRRSILFIENMGLARRCER